jgi:uncharacterized protein Yka (UPF0111/DUF47 family)
MSFISPNDRDDLRQVISTTDDIVHRIEDSARLVFLYRAW